jgi:DNA repair protein RadD
VIGLTATPYRLDGAPLGDVFGHIVHGPSVSELVANGVLINPRIYAPPGPDLNGVHSRGGDFVVGELELAVAKKNLVGDIVKHWEKHANGGRTVAFGVGIFHSKMIAEAFGSIGYHIDGGSPQEEREYAIAKLEAGEIKVLSNCDLIGEGWDLPSLDCAILARPTQSMALHRQQIGRVMRACPGKEGALVLDHAGNTHRHGVPTDEVDVSLEGKAKRKQEAAPRTCKECFAIIEEYPCWACGFKPEMVAREIESVGGELVEFVPETIEQKRAWYAEKVALASANGYKLGYAKFKYKEKYHVWPRFKEIDATYVCSGHQFEQRSYGVICARCLRTPAMVSV